MLRALVAVFALALLVPAIAQAAIHSSGTSGAGRSSPVPAEPSSIGASARPGQPVGPGGSWSKVWSDEFSGSTLSSQWVALEGYRTNHVTTRARNVTLDDGKLVLTRSDKTTGAEVDSARYDGAKDGYELQVGDYVEASVLFPGDGERLYNWSAFWASGPGWPAAGEHDVAEVINGDLLVIYHSPSGSHNLGIVDGYWGGTFHTYGLYRGARSAEVYMDGQLVRSYPTDDDGKGEAVLLNVGGGTGPPMFGEAGAVRVDWVRAWRPA